MEMPYSLPKASIPVSAGLTGRKSHQEREEQEVWAHSSETLPVISGLGVAFFLLQCPGNQRCPKHAIIV